MLALLSVLLLGTHLVCMNISSGGPLLCVWLARRKLQNQNPEATSVVLRLAAWTNWTLVIGAMLGVGLGWVSASAGDTRLVRIMPLFRYKIGWGLIELVFSAGWMFAYWAWLRWRPPQSRVARFFHAMLPILSATNLMYHFPTLLTVMSKTARGDLDVVQPVNAAIFRQLAFRPNVFAHSVHFALASIAVSGVLLFWIARRCEHAKAFTITGARFAFVATAFQLPVGLWLLFVTPAAEQSRLVGGDALLSTLFVSSLFCAFYLLQNLAGLAFGEFTANLPRRCAVLLGATIFLMTGVLRLLRS